MTLFVDDIEVVEQTATVTGPTSAQTLTVAAPTGKKAISGGFHDPNGSVVVRYSYPSSDGATWNLEVYTNASGTFTTTASAVCLG
jgi:hypothetical protein